MTTALPLVRLPKMVSSNAKTRIAVISVVATIIYCTLLATPMMVQAESAVPAQLVAGTMHLPPFAMKTESGDWEGLSIDLFKMVAQDLRTEFELREYSGVATVKDAVANRDLDLILLATVTERWELISDFSNPY